MGYKFQFVTLAGFHALNLSMFELARGYKLAGMTAYSRLQEKEFSRETQYGYEAVKHQRFVGTGYFDQVQQVISGGLASTMALAGVDGSRAVHGKENADPPRTWSRCSLSANSRRLSTHSSQNRSWFGGDAAALRRLSHRSHSSERDAHDWLRCRQHWEAASLHLALRKLGYVNPHTGTHKAGSYASRRFRNTYLKTRLAVQKVFAITGWDMLGSNGRPL